MKQLIAILSLIFLFQTSHAQTVTNSAQGKRIAIQLIDQAYNPVEHRRIFVFQAVNSTDMLNLTQVYAYFSKMKGFLRMMPLLTEKTSSERVVLVFDESVDLLKSPDLNKIMSDNGWVLVNTKN
jgi:hypothetical protein